MIKEPPTEKFFMEPNVLLLHHGKFIWDYFRRRFAYWFEPRVKKFQYKQSLFTNTEEPLFDCGEPLLFLFFC